MCLFAARALEDAELHQRVAASLHSVPQYLGKMDKASLDEVSTHHQHQHIEPREIAEVFGVG
jgi:hypothetical protein